MRTDSDCIKATARAAQDEHPASELDPVERRRQTLSKLEVPRAYYAAWPNAILQGLKKRSRGPSEQASGSSTCSPARGGTSQLRRPVAKLPERRQWLDSGCGRP